jgi:eukaryotic-like serine/threonine-protein kinase
VESSTFLDHLKTSGLLAEEQLAAVSGLLSKSQTGLVVADLVDQGLLTRFQVKQLEAGQAKGLVLGQYHLLDELGRGGYGCVYKARHKLMNRIVALKVIAPERVEDSRARAWFRREVLAATQLAHPNIALAYDADEIDGVLFFAMEFIDGLNLDTLVRERGPVPIGTACEMLLQTAKALQYAHEKGMVHRDIKPANLLIPHGTAADAGSEFSPQTCAAGARPVLVKVVDFGLARLQSSSSNNTLVLQNERGFVGTPAYVSPEQARNVHDVDIRSDLYSLGCTFYYALAGRAPFQASTPLEIVVQHLEKEPEAIERLRPEIPLPLASILRRLMAKKPDKRFQTPGELLGELGFFYNLDRSGVQRALPWAMSESIRPVQPVPQVSLPTPAMEVPRPSPAQESEYAPTCVIARDDAARDRTVAVEESAGREASFATSHTVQLLHQGALTTTYVAQELSAPVSPHTEPSADPESCAIDRDLIRHWQQWASLIDDLAGGRAPALDDASYRVLHRDLLAACRAQATRLDRPMGALFQQIAEFVQPWLTLPTLRGMDGESLASLQKQCHALAAKMGHGSRGSWRWAIGLFFLLLMAGTSYFLIETVGGRNAAPISAWSGFLQRNPLLSLAVLLPAALIAAVALMNKFLRVPRPE